MHKDFNNKLSFNFSIIKTTFFNNMILNFHSLVHIMLNKLQEYKRIFIHFIIHPLNKNNCKMDTKAKLLFEGM